MIIKIKLNKNLFIDYEATIQTHRTGNTVIITYLYFAQIELKQRFLFTFPSNCTLVFSIIKYSPIYSQNSPYSIVQNIE